MIAKKTIAVMNQFAYRKGILHAENVPVTEIAAAVGTPFYLYSTATLLRNLRMFSDALAGMDHIVCYAMKAASNQAILKILAKAGAGMDVVSEGEYRRAVAVGVPGDRIVFSGVGKTEREIRTALTGGVRQLNVESEPELDTISRVASDLGLMAPVAIRVNPDVDARTHAKIATGGGETKFGVPIARVREVYSYAATLPGIEIVGIDVHIGSQITDLEPYDLAFTKVAELTGTLRADGHNIRRIDLGGGIGIPYSGEGRLSRLPTDYGEVIRRTIGHLGCEVEIEPGRAISGNAGILVSRVIYVKAGQRRNFLILDSAMNDLARPSLYDAHHEAIPVTEPRPEATRTPIDIVGPVCETGDIFARQRPMPPLEAGDLIAFRDGGAYGAVMASEYNSRPLVPEVLVKGDHFAVIRSRPGFDEMINRDIVPHWV